MVKPVLARPTPWSTVLLLCGKCSRKLDGGYGPKKKDSLRAVLRAALTESGRRRQVRLVETPCLGLCPKRAVTALNASHPERILVIPRGTAPGEALAHLLPP